MFHLSVFVYLRGGGGGGGEPEALGYDIDYTFQPGPTNNSIKSNCNMFVPVRDLGPRSHTFQVSIYPNVTDGKSLVTATKVSQKFEFCECMGLKRIIKPSFSVCSIFGTKIGVFC